MNPEAKKIWIEALRSGKYKQGRHVLCAQITPKTKKYCCLGVLVDCYFGQEKKEYYWKPSSNDIISCYAHGLTKEWQTGSLPRKDEFTHWTGLITSENEIKLINLNDTEKLDFNQIADWIEQNL